MKLNIDYVSDLHLTHYISKNESITKIDKLVQDKISMQVKGDILVVAGDIDEDINRVSELLYSCSKYYKKVIFVLGNHEYYIPVIKYIYTDPMAKEYNYNSMNKVYRLNEIFKDNNDIIILDKTNNTKGLYTYNTFLLAGDTLWYKPVTLVDKLYNYPMQNDSRFILAELSKKDSEKALKAFVDVVTDELKKEHKVQVVGFGTFEVSMRAEREGRNPQTGETMKIAACKAPKFKAGKALKDAINE